VERSRFSRPSLIPLQSVVRLTSLSLFLLSWERESLLHFFFLFSADSGVMKCCSRTPETCVSPSSYFFFFFFFFFLSAPPFLVFFSLHPSFPDLHWRLVNELGDQPSLRLNAFSLFPSLSTCSTTSSVLVSSDPDVVPFFSSLKVRSFHSRVY